MYWIGVLLATIGASLILGALTFVSALIGVLVNAMPEYDDVARVAAETGRPAKDVLNEAIAAVHADLSGGRSALAHHNPDNSGG